MVGDKNKDGKLGIEEFKEVLIAIDSNLTRYPSTATVAIQQGRYLGQVLNDLAKKDEDEPSDGSDIKPFRYKHIGGYEYVGAEGGLIERGSQGTSIVTGLGAWWLWTAVFL